MVIPISAWGIQGLQRSSNLPNKEYTKSSIWVWTFDYSYAIYANPVITWLLLQNECRASMVQTPQHSAKTFSNILWNNRSDLWPTTSLYTLPLLPLLFVGTQISNSYAIYPASIPLLLSSFHINCIQFHRHVSNGLPLCEAYPLGSYDSFIL